MADPTVARVRKRLTREFQLDYEVKTITPVVTKVWGEVVFWILAILTAGLFALIFRWCKRVIRSLRYTKVPVDQAKYLLLLDEGNEEVIIDIRRVKDKEGKEGKDSIVTEYRYTQYLYDKEAITEINDPKTGKTSEKGAFVMIRNLLDATNNEVRSHRNCVQVKDLAYLKSLYGVNSTRIRVTPIWKLFVDEALSTFNLYQIFAAVIWYFRDYFAYAVTILIFAAVSIVFAIYVLRKDQNKINSMAQKYEVQVFRRQEDGTTVKQLISSEELVPGDVFEVNAKKPLPCDAILLEGQCLIDEAALTGESVPMHKTPLPATEADFSESEKGHLLFSGTNCLTSESLDDPSKPAVAMVYQTGFNTSKGLLIRSIMFNNPGLYQFEKDGNWFLLYLIVISICFIIAYYIIAYTDPEKPEFADVGLPSVDILLCMVPPGLTLCLGIGVQYAQGRLAFRKITALKGRLINASGRMKVVLFDKTGTLTINEVVLDRVYVSNRSVDRSKCVLMERERNLSDDQAFHKRLCHHFAADHTLIKTKETDAKGQEYTKILGDPLEEELYNFAQANLEDSAEENGKKYMKKVKINRGSGTDTLGVITVFGFKSELQRMSVVTEDTKTAEIYAYIKGAPERIIELSDPQTLPSDINQQVTDFAKSGLRVIAFGCKKLNNIAAGQEYTREMTEGQIEFQGLALFKNNLKEKTAPTLQNLKQYEFLTGMITGDNINTAISVSKTCGLIDTSKEDIAICTYPQQSDQFQYQLINEHGDPIGEFKISDRQAGEKKIIGAIDDINFRKISKELGLELNKPIDLKKAPILIQLAEHIRVFARMNPEQKALIVKIFKEYYKDKNYAVGFCGDGANDCIALKHADIGVSLSKNEASLSAPFVSAIEDISCVEIISIQGKAALTTNYDCFRYFCLYSIIQTIGLVMLFSQKTEYSVPMYLTMDIPIALNVANCIGLLKPKTTLTKKLPKHTLFYAKFIVSILLNVVYTFSCMIFGIWMLRKDSGFYSAKSIAESGIDDEKPTYESTIISLLALQGTFHIGVSFNLAGNFKDRFFNQIYICVSLVLYILYQFYLVFNNRTFWPKVDNFLMDEYNFVVFDKKMKGNVMILLFFYSFLSITTECIIIWGFRKREKPDLKKVESNANHNNK